MKHSNHNRHFERQTSNLINCRVGFRLLAMTNVLFLLLLSACGFHPVYGVNKYTATGVEEHFAKISINNIPDREGQYLRNALIDRFYRNGRPVNPAYNLNVDPVEERLEDLDITKTSDATRGQLRLSTRITLTGPDGNVLLERNLRAITSYNILASEFATRVAEESARKNALDDLANQIEIHLSLYFKRSQ